MKDENDLTSTLGPHPSSQFNLLGLAGLLGAGRTIAKPFTLDEMVQAVNQLLDSA